MLDERDGAVVDAGGEGDDGRGPGDVRVVDDLVDDALQVGVVAGDDADEHVAGAGDGVGLEHLGDRGEVLDDGGVAAAALADLERAERRDRVAERRGVDVGRHRASTPRALQPVEPGLHGAAGDAEPAGGPEHADAAAR